MMAFSWPDWPVLCASAAGVSLHRGLSLCPDAAFHDDRRGLQQRPSRNWGRRVLSGRLH